MYYNDKKRLKIVQVVNIGIDIDEALSEESENPVQNKVVTEALENKQDKLTAGGGIKLANDVISADVKVTEIYNMSNSNANINLGYTSGIVGQTLVTAQVDFGEDDYLIVEYCCFKGNNNGNTGGRQNVLLCGLKRRNNLNTCSACSMVGYINSEGPSVQTPYFMFKFQCKPVDNNFISYFSYNGELQPNNESYYISRIYSVKIGD